MCIIINEVSLFGRAVVGERKVYSLDDDYFRYAKGQQMMK